MLSNINTYKSALFFLLICFFSCKHDKNAVNTQDSSEVRFYESKSIFYQDRMPDSAIYFARQGLLLARKLNDLHGEALMMTRFARINEKYDNFDLALKYQQQALSVYEQLNDPSAVSKANLQLGALHAKMKNFTQSEALLKLTLASYKDIKDTDGMIKSYTHLGDGSMLSGDTDQAIEHYSRARELHEKRPLSEEHLSLLHTLGKLHSARGDHAKALEYFKEGITRSKNSQFKVMHTAFMRNAGAMSDSLGDDESAISYHRQSVQKAHESGLPDEEARSLVSLASVVRDRDADQSIKHLKNALGIAHTIGNMHLAAEIYFSLSEVYRQQAKYQESIQALKEHHRLIDSLENVEKGHKLAALQTGYDLAESKLRIEGLELKNEKRTYERNAGIILAFSALLLLLVMGFYYNRTRLLNKRLHESNLIKDKLFSIIGHDLRNPIGGITQLLAMMEEGNISAEEHQKLIAEMRKQGDVTLEILNALLNWGEAQLKGVHVKPSSFKPSLISSNNVAALSRQAANKSIKITDNIPSQLMVYGDSNHFDFVLRNLLSNAIKFSPQASTVELDASLDPKTDMTIFSVKDNGKGISRQQQELFYSSNLEITYGTGGEKGTGIGLMLSKEFVKANHGRIWIESEEGKGAAFYFTFRNKERSL